METLPGPARTSPKAEIKNLRINSTVNASSSLLAPQNVGLVTGNAENAVIDRVTLSGSFGYQSSQNDSSQVVFLGDVAGGGWLTYSAATNYQGYIIDSSSTGNITARLRVSGPS